jgi:hypothetical protein
MRMTSTPRFTYLIFGLVLSATSVVRAEQIDDLVLTEQIRATVGQYRFAMQDLALLTKSVSSQGRGAGDPMLHPKVQQFVSYSVVPTQREMARLFQRYEDEYGHEAFLKAARSNGFSDLAKDVR